MAHGRDVACGSRFALPCGIQAVRAAVACPDCVRRIARQPADRGRAEQSPAEPLVAPAAGTVRSVFVQKGDSVYVPRVVRQTPVRVSDVIKSDATAKSDVDAFFAALAKATSAEGRSDVFEKAKGIPDLVAIIRPDSAKASSEKEASEAAMSFTVSYKGRLVEIKGSDLFVWASTSGTITEVSLAAGSKAVYGETRRRRLQPARWRSVLLHSKGSAARNLPAPHFPRRRRVD